MTPEQLRALERWTRHDKRKSVLHRIKNQRSVLLEYPAHSAAPLLKIFHPDGSRPATITLVGARAMGFTLYSDLYKRA